MTSTPLGERGITPEAIETTSTVTFENLTLTKSVLKTTVKAPGADKANSILTIFIYEGVHQYAVTWGEYPISLGWRSWLLSLPHEQRKEHRSRDIGPVPIIENKQTKKLVGIVTDRDLAWKIVAEGRDPKSTKAEEVMTRKVVTCHAKDDLQKALDVMSRHQLRRIPVVDNNNEIVGIIAQADVATRVDQPEETAAVARGISQSK